MDAELLLSGHHDGLGESPRWDADRSTLWWVDAAQGLVHRWSWDTAAVDTLDGGRVGSIALTESGDPLIAGGRTVRTLGGSVVAEVPPEIGGNLNDGAVDPAGRLHVGTARPLQQPPRDAALLRFEPSVSPVTVLRGVGMSNGIAWDGRRRIMYYVDSWDPYVSRFDTTADGSVVPDTRMLFATVPSGIPDGLAVDVEGGVWLARWGAARVTRYAPDGRADLDVRIACRNATACAFGGPGRTHLIVTSARDADHPDEHHAGALFIADVGVAGPPVRRVAGY